MIPEKHLAALKIISRQLSGLGHAWAVTGSTGMALQGMRVTPHDIDLQTGREGAYALGQALAEYTVDPVHYAASERIHSHLGKFEIEGVEVEVMGAMQKLLPDGSWEEPVEVEPYLRAMQLDGLTVPVMALEHEQEAYDRMGRTVQAEKIRDFLRSRGQGA